MEKIICAAIHYEDGIKYSHQPKNINTGFIICGLRHCNCIMTRVILSDEIDTYPETQGFITDQNNFKNRYEAYSLALENGQIRVSKMNKRLNSEDLY